MTAMTQTTQSPLVAHWELVTDARGRTRPEMRWEIVRSGDETSEVSLAA
ncbi:MAG: hypothetical protein WCA29_07160 [Jiangellales bacterium]